MTKREFARLLARGHGRAVTFLLSHAPASYQAAVRRACERPKREWWGMEHARGQFLVDTLRAAGMLDEESPRLREKLKTSRGDVQSHLFDLVGALARAGDGEARQAMRDAFAKNAQRKSTTGADEIIETGGLNGFLFVAEHVAAWLALDDWEIGYLVRSLEDQIGEENTNAALAKAAEDNPLLADWLKKLQAQRMADKEKRNAHRPRKTSTEREIRKAINSGVQWTWLRSLGRWADDATALTFARELLTEPDPARQTRLLHLFRLRKEPFPFGPLPILELAREADEKRLQAACDILENITHPDVRAFALETNGLNARERARLLVQNPGEGDWPRLAAWLTSRLPDYEAHAFGIAVFGYFKRQPAPEAAETLIRVYETDPCSYCRTRAVEHLLSLSALPDTLRDECRWDAEPETRRLVS